MGLILRQSFKHGIVTVAALGVGMINVFFIYTAVLSTKELGFVRYIISSVEMLLPFVILGFNSVTIRFFPQFKGEDKKSNGFLFFLLLIPFLCFLIFSLFFYGFYEEMLSFYSGHPDKLMIKKYFVLVPILLLPFIINTLLNSYIANHNRIVVPAILGNLWIKIAFPLFMIAYFFEYISFFQVLIGITLAYYLATFGLLTYLKILGGLDLKPDFSRFKLPLVKDMGHYALISIIGGMSVQIATQIDTLMVGYMIDFGNAGIYTIALFISAVISIPMNSVFGISGPIVAKHWNNNETDEINELYHKTSVNLLILGVLILTGIWASIDLIFEIIPNGADYKEGKYVVLLLGFAKIADMATSINTHIIIYSKYYQFNLYMTFLLAGLNIIFNLIFIPIFGLVGVAMATLTSMVLYNLLKLIFVLVKFKMHVDILINSVFISLFYIGGVLYLNISTDLTILKQQFLRKIGF